MSRLAQQYKHETASLRRYFAGGDSPVLKYISVVEAYVGELRKVHLEELLDEIEYNELFTGLLCLIGKHYAPDQFLSVVRGGYVRSFSPEFMGYALSCKGQFKRKPTWEELCNLNCKYDLWRASVKFREDSLEYATKNISLKILWGIA